MAAAFLQSGGGDARRQQEAARVSSMGGGGNIPGGGGRPARRTGADCGPAMAATDVHRAGPGWVESVACVFGSVGRGRVSEAGCPVERTASAAVCHRPEEGSIAYALPSGWRWHLRWF